jgi:hypothetical protein
MQRVLIAQIYSADSCHLVSVIKPLSLATIDHQLTFQKSTLPHLRKSATHIWYDSNEATTSMTSNLNIYEQPRKTSTLTYATASITNTQPRYLLIHSLPHLCHSFVLYFLPAHIIPQLTDDYEWRGSWRCKSSAGGWENSLASGA